MTNPGVSNLVAFWSMDEFSGTRYDKSSIGNHLTDNNTVGRYEIGKRFRTANLAAIQSESLSIPNNFWINMGGFSSFTIGVWINPHEVTNEGRILAKWEAGAVTNSEYMIAFESGATKKLIFYVNNGSANYSVRADNFGALTNGVWYFVCCYYDSLTNGIYISVNGVVNLSAGPSSIADRANPLYFGRESTGAAQYYYDGLIDEAFIYGQRMLTSAERGWMYNSGYGRTYEDVAEIKPPVVSIETGLTIGNLPVQVFDKTLKYVGLIEDYYSLSWAERYAEPGDFELEVPMEWESNSLIDFGNFLYIKSSDKLMIIEDKKVSVAEDKMSILITGQSAESLLKRRILEEIMIVDGPSEIAIYDLVLKNLIIPVTSNRRITLFDQGGFFEMPITTEFKDVFEPQKIYDIVNIITKESGLGFKVVCDDLTVSSPKLIFYVHEGIDRSYAQSDNMWVVFSDKFENVLASSFYSSEKDMTTVTYILTDDIPPFTEIYGWFEDPEPTDIDRIETVLEINLARDSTDPPMSGAKFVEILDTKNMTFIKESGPIGLLEGDFDVQFNHKYGEDFFMGDIVQCNIHGAEVGARVIELVRSYSVEGEKTYLGLDFIML